MGSLFHEIYASNISTIFIIMLMLLLVWSATGVIIVKQMRIVGAVVAVIAVSAILYITVFSRNKGGTEAELIPFSALARANIQPEMYRSMLMNIFLFVPLGCSLPFAFDGKTAKRISLAILIGFLLSSTVEAIQFIFSLGIAETDDVICNTLGTTIGGCAYPLSLLWMKLIRKIKERKRRDE